MRHFAFSEQNKFKLTKHYFYLVHLSFLNFYFILFFYTGKHLWTSVSASKDKDNIQWQSQDFGQGGQPTLKDGAFDCQLLTIDNFTPNNL